MGRAGRDEDARRQTEQRWRGRPVLAGLLRLVILLVPVLCAAGTTVLASRVLPRGHGTSRVLYVGLGFAAALVAALVTERLARRLLPLATLLKLTLLFPDRAPSRFKIARKSNVVQTLAHSVEEGDASETAVSVLALLAQLTAHDKKTRGHAERVRVYSDLLAEQMHLGQRERDLLRWGALLHDIGKLDVAAEILNKPGKPTDVEWSILRSHPARGAELAESLLPWLGEWGTAIRQHHERYDGSGYPEGLTGSAISRAGRLVAVVDAYEVMTAARSYKKPMTTAKAREELARCAGTHFDPVMVRAFLSISLPKLLWATGPLSFIVQLPFIGMLRDAGTRAVATAGSQAVTVAGAAVIATTGTALVGIMPSSPASDTAPAAPRPPVAASAPLRPGIAASQPSGAPVPNGAVTPAVDIASAPRTDPTTDTASSAVPDRIPSTPPPEDPVAAPPAPVPPAPTAAPAPSHTPASPVPSATSTPTPGPTATPTPTPTPSPTPTGTPTPTPAPSTPAPPHAVIVHSAPTGTTADNAATVAFTVPHSTSQECALDGGPWSACSSPLTLTNLSDGPHQLEIRGTNEDGTGPSTTITWTVDTTAPALTILTGPPALTNSTSATVQFAADDPSATVTCSLDGASPTSCSGSWSGTVTSGAHTLELVATDALGNWTSRAYSWTVDTTPPSLTVAGGPTGTTASDSATVGIVTDSDATVTCTLNGTDSACTPTHWTVSGLTDGPYVLVVTAQDPAGNTTSRTATWTVDTTGPALTLTGAPTGTVAISSASVGIATDADATVACALDGTASPCSSTSWTATNLPDGPHTLSVTATDPAGNTTSRTATWTVDTTGPALTLSGAPTGTVASSSATVGITTDGDTVSCTLDGAASSCSSTSWTATGLSDGPHTLVVTAADPYGNTTSRTATWTVDTTGPALTLTGAPTGTVATGSATVGIATDADATVACTLDGQSSSCTTSSWTATNLADGPHTLSVTATDPVGNTTTRTATWTVDTTGPALTLTGGPTGTTSSTTASVSIATDADAIVACTLDGSTSTCTSSSWTASGLADGPHTLSVTATDPVGNTTTRTATWTVDTTGPALTLTGGPTGTTSSTTASVSIATDTDAIVSCTLDGLSSSCSNTSWAKSGLPDGDHTLVVTATDPSGNTTSRTRAWTVKTGAPSVTITGGPSGSTTSTSATVPFTVSDPTLLGIVTVLDTVQCSLDGGAWTPCSSPWTGTGLSVGTHTLTVRITDPAGNRGVDSLTWTVSAPADTTAPVVTITGGPGTTTSTSASVPFTVDDPTATVTCSLDGGPAAACTSPWTGSSLAVGSHTLVVTATDGAGNSGRDTYSWTVSAPADTTAPVISGISGPGTSTSTSATVTWTVDDPSATVTCTLNGASTPCGPTSWSGSGLAPATYNLVVTATDGAGNVGHGYFSWTVTPSATPPSAPSIDSGPAEGSNAFSANVTIGFSSADPSATFECSVDGSAFSSCTSPASIRGLSSGPHSFSVRSIVGGQAGPATTRNWTKDASDKPTLTSTPASSTSSTTATFAFSTAYNDSFECKLDGGAWTACSSGVTFTGLSSGGHDFQVRVVDYSGANGGNTSYSWTVS